MTVVGVLDADRLEREASDRADAGTEVRHVQGRRGEPRLVVERVEAVGQPGRRDHRDPARRMELVAQVVAERDEVDEVVRMQVRDRDARSACSAR